MPGSWPHGPNYYTRAIARRGPHAMPPVGVPTVELGYLPGTAVRFGGAPAPTAAAQWQARLDQRPARTLPEAAGCNPCRGGSEAGQTGGEFAYVTDPRTAVYRPPSSAMGRGGPAFGPGGPGTPSGQTSVERRIAERLGINTPAQPMGLTAASPPPTVFDTVGEPMDDPSTTPTTVVEEPPASLAPKKRPWGWIIGGSLLGVGVVTGLAYAATRKRRT